MKHVVLSENFPFEDYVIIDNKVETDENFWKMT